MNQQVGSVEVEIRANLAPLLAGFKRAETEAKTLGRQLQVVEAAQPFAKMTNAVNAFGSAMANVATAAASIFNPTALAIGAVTTAIGFVQGAVSAYVNDALSGADKVNFSLKFHEDVLSRIKEMYGEAGEAAIRFGQDSEAALQFDADRDVIQTLAALNAGTQEFLNKVGASGARTGGAGPFQVNSELRVFDDALTDLYVSMKNGEADFDAFEESVRNNENATLAQKDAILTLTGTLDALAKAYGTAAKAADGLTDASQSAIGRRFDNLPDFPGPATPRPRMAIDLVNDPAPRAARGGGGGGAKRDVFGGLMDRAQDRQRAMEQEAHALTLSGEALARYRAELQILNPLHDEWNKLTESQRGALEAEADKLGDTAAAMEQQKEQLKGLKEAQQQAEDAFAAVGDAAEDLFMGLMQGGDAAKMAIAQLVAELLRAALLGDGPLSFFFGGGVLGGGGGAGASAVASVPSGVRAPSGRVGSVSARSAGGGGGSSSPTIIVQGNMDRNAAADVRAELRRFQREQDERQRNSWRVN